MISDLKLIEPNNAYYVVSPAPRSVQNRKLNSKMIQTNDPYASPRVKNGAVCNLSPYSAQGGVLSGTPMANRQKISAQYVVDSKRWADQEDQMKKFFNCPQINSRVGRADASS